MFIKKEDAAIVNNTYRFVFPILRLYGEEFCEKLGKIYKDGIFIDDVAAQRPDDADYLHVVIDLQRTRANFGDIVGEYVGWMWEKGWLGNYYALDSDSGKYVMMIRIPEKYQGCIDKFVQGDVDLFSEQDVNKCFQARNKANVGFFRYCRDVIRIKKRVKIDLDQEMLNF